MHKVSKLTRSLHVVDAANELGSGFFSEADASRLHSAWLATVPVRQNDLVMAATGPGTAAELGFGWKHGLLQIRRGQNGADFAIIEYLEDMLPRAASFDHLYLGTGDHEMVEITKKWIAAGVPVTVVGRSRGIHHEYFKMPVEIKNIDEQWALAS